MGIFFGVALVIAIIMIIVTSARKRGKIGKLNKKQREAQKELIRVQSSLVSRGELVIIENSSIITKPNEAVHFGLAANRLITKNKVVGRTGGGSGVSVRVAKGLSVHSGRGRSRTVYGNVTSAFTGMFLITNQRLVFVHAQQGFEVSLDKLTAINEQGGLLIQSGNNSFLVQTKANRLCIDTVHLILNKQKEAAQ
ncbi:MAG: hypothetical protein LBS90_00260 [Oscillospiraceae bacterium]|jgi:hypothetical protein|nr:hypothetical protein [Oscillospiraceae bacterium]